MDKIAEMRQKLEALKVEVRELTDAKKVEEAKVKMQELRDTKESLKIEEELVAEEKRDLESQDKKEEKRGEIMDKNLEYRAITKILLKQELTPEERDSHSSNVANSGAILPEGFVKEVQLLQSGFPALKNYAHVIPVLTNTGKMPVASGSETKKLAKLSTDTEMVKEMLATTPITYAVEDYGKIFPVENSVLADAGVDFYNTIVAPAIAEDAVNAENAAIITIVLANDSAGESGTDYNAIVKTINKVKPSLQKGLVVLTNVSGYSYLDTLIDGQGRPMLADSIKVEGGKIFKGKEVVVMDDADLPAITGGKAPFYIVNLRALIKFFNRQGYEIATSTEAGFTYNQTFLRVIERFDVVAGDTRACKFVELTV